MLTTYLFRLLQNAPFRSQIFKIFFASGGKGARLTPLTKNLRTFLLSCAITFSVVQSVMLNKNKPEHFKQRFCNAVVWIAELVRVKKVGN